jgi:hypothetical protein
MTGKPKIALCLSGEPRSSMASFPYIYEAFLKDNHLYDIDVYIHSWKGFRALDLYKPKKYNIENVNQELYVSNEIPKIKNLPKDLDILFKISEGFTPNVSLVKNNILMIHSLKKCFDLIEEPYDLYIRCRYDIFFRSKFWVYPIIRDLIEQKYDMFIPLKFAYRKDNDKYNDQIAIGNYSSMKTYTDIIDNLDLVINKTNRWNFEMWLKYWLNFQKVKVNRHFVDYTLIRNSSLVTNEVRYNNFLDE